MILSKAIEAKKFDLRLRDKLLGEGKLSVSEVDKYIQDLEDCSENAITTEESNRPGMPMAENTEAPTESTEPQI